MVITEGNCARTKMTRTQPLTHMVSSEIHIHQRVLITRMAQVTRIQIKNFMWFLRGKVIFWLLG